MKLGSKSKRTKQIIAIINRHKTLIENQQLLKSKGLPIQRGNLYCLLRDTGTKYTTRDEVTDALKKQWKPNLYIEENAKLLGMTLTGIREFGYRHGLKCKLHVRGLQINVAKKALIIQLIGHGYTYDAIGKLFGCTRQNVEILLKVSNKNIPKP